MLFAYLLSQSGGQVETSRIATALKISRITVENHLQAMEITQTLTRVRPFFGSGQREIVKMPKIYAFDTGYVTFVRGWDPLRPQDYGILWEHLVLEFLQARFPDQAIRYWRNKAGQEIDFVLVKSRDQIDAVECKWDPTDFDASALHMFRSFYPKGDNYLVCPSADHSYVKGFGSILVRICVPDEIGKHETA